MSQMTAEEIEYWKERADEPLSFQVMEDESVDDGLPLEELHRALDEYMKS